MLPAVQQMLKEECARFVSDKLSQQAEDTTAWSEIPTGYYLKATSGGRQFLLDLRPDGSLSERGIFNPDGDKWDGRWRQAILPVGPRKAGPGGWTGKSHGIVITIGPYSSYLLQHSPTYFAGVEYHDGKKGGRQMVCFLGDNPQVLDIDRLNELHGEPQPRFR